MDFNDLLLIPYWEEAKGNKSWASSAKWTRIKIWRSL